MACLSAVRSTAMVTDPTRVGAAMTSLDFNTSVFNKEVVSLTVREECFCRNKKLNVLLRKGQIDSLYCLNYNGPWTDGENKRTSRTFMVQVETGEDDGLPHLPYHMLMLEADLT